MHIELSLWLAFKSLNPWRSIAIYMYSSDALQDLRGNSGRVVPE